jgi:DNA-binding transcriptional regulator YdaS (Cro superfamily)
VISIEPTALSYLNLGQLKSGGEAVEAIERAIEILTKRLSNDQDVSATLSQAYCSLVDIFMTELW